MSRRSAAGQQSLPGMPNVIDLTKRRARALDKGKRAKKTSAVWWFKFITGLALGASVPAGSFGLAHYELSWDRLQNLTEPGSWHDAAILVFLLGALLFSSKTVWQLAARELFLDKWKATGFVLLTEGVLVLSHLEWLRFGALAILVGVNAAATGLNWANRKKPESENKT